MKNEKVNPEKTDAILIDHPNHLDIAKGYLDRLQACKTMYGNSFWMIVTVRDGVVVYDATGAGKAKCSFNFPVPVPAEDENKEE